MYKILILLIFSVLFSQEVVEPCVGTCFSDGEVQGLYTAIQELEHADTSNQKIIENLNSQIYMYIQSDSLYQLQIEDYKKQLELKEDMIKLVKPKWHENKYLWFSYGLSLTVGSVYLAGQIN